MKTVTANRLTDGRVIYRTAEGGWSSALTDAVRLDEEAAKDVLIAAEAESGIAVGPYLIDLDASGPAGQKWRRESIRLAGPSAGTTQLLKAS